ncbi:L-lactate permease [Calditerricola satsumensis]|uniref:L-lactate permease n=1 Tax=Calditerricola satsumensis TaxID=373054 RepID=UPI003571654B
MAHRRGAFRLDSPLRSPASLVSCRIGHLILPCARRPHDSLGHVRCPGRKSSCPRPILRLTHPLDWRLGGYLTGSNTGANALFAAAQAQGAQGAGLPVLWAVAGQNVAASLCSGRMRLSGLIESPPRKPRI